MPLIETTIFTKEELYKMNNDSKYGFNWINLTYVNHINKSSDNIKYKIYPTGNVRDISVGREYIAFKEDKILSYDEKIRYNIL